MDTKVTAEELKALFHALPKKRNRRYIITWSWGAQETFWGKNYINALYVNGITPEMAEYIIAHEMVEERED